MHTKTLERKNLIYVAAIAIVAGLIVALMPLMSQAQINSTGNGNNNLAPGGLYCYLPFIQLIAPGYEETHGSLDRPNDPICVTLPQGIVEKKLGVNKFLGSD